MYLQIAIGENAHPRNGPHLRPSCFQGSQPRFGLPFARFVQVSIPSLAVERGQALSTRRPPNDHRRVLLEQVRRDARHGFLHKQGYNGRDALRLDHLRLADATSWDAFDTQSDPNVNVDLLRIEFGDNRPIFINKYFDNLHADEDLSSEGPDCVETIAFADDPSVDFAQVKDLIPY